MSRTRLVLFGASLLLCFFLFRPYGPARQSQQESYGRNGYAHNGDARQLAWGIAKGVFVISLPRRTDRRKELIPLLQAHGLHSSRTDDINASANRSIQFIPATDGTHPNITRIMAHVAAQRRLEYFYYLNKSIMINEAGRKAGFNDGFGKSPEEDWGSDLWTVDDVSDTEQKQRSWNDLLDPDEDHGILCEKGNPFNPKKFAYLDPSSSTILTNAPTTETSAPASGAPRFTYLTKAMVACWHSHVQVIRQIAQYGMESHTLHQDSALRDSVVVPQGSFHPDPAMRDPLSRRSERRSVPTFIILEDDVDFEWEIEPLLMEIWDALPLGWEIVMLGHCWSDEARYPAKFTTTNPLHVNGTQDNARGNSKSLVASLHPSNSPLCTHAYALSPHGARRIYNFLRHPAFAYSRPLDQALAWLIRSGLIKEAYSIVPSLIIQTKDGKSDISERRGSRWRDKLVDSTRERVRGRARQTSGWFGDWRW